MSRRKHKHSTFKKNIVWINPIIHFLLFVLFLQRGIDGTKIQAGAAVLYSLASLVASCLTMLGAMHRRKKTHIIFLRALGIYSGIIIAVVMGMVLTQSGFIAFGSREVIRTVFSAFLLSVVLLVAGNGAAYHLNGVRRAHRHEKEGTMPY